MASRYEGRSITDDMAEGCAGIAGKATAVKAVRALCRYFGGSLIYMPIRASNGQTAGEMRGVLADAVGGNDAERILAKLMALFGGYQLYMPLEKNVFKKELALEIFERLDGEKEKVRDLCREYGISFNQVYRLWKIGQKYKLEGVNVL